MSAPTWTVAPRAPRAPNFNFHSTPYRSRSYASCFGFASKFHLKTIDRGHFLFGSKRKFFVLQLTPHGRRRTEAAAAPPLHAQWQCATPWPSAVPSINSQIKRPISMRSTCARARAKRFQMERCCAMAHVCVRRAGLCDLPSDSYWWNIKGKLISYIK